MFQKQALQWNCTSLFSTVFSWIFSERSKQNCTKNMKICFTKKKRLRNQFWNVFFHLKVNSWSIFGVPLGPRGSWEAPRNIELSVYFKLRLKNGPDQPPGSPREAPGVPQAPPRHDFGSILDWFFGPISTLAEFHPRLPGILRQCDEDTKVSRNCLRDYLDVAVVALLCVLSGWTSSHMRAVMGTLWKALDTPGVTMHAGCRYRAICTMEL